MKKKIFTVVFVVLVGAYLFVRQKYPLMNDISTNLENPPAFFAQNLVAQRDFTYPDKFREMQKEWFPNVQPLLWEKSVEESYEKAKILAKDVFQWEIVEESISLPGEKKFHAVATTQVGFKDDIVVVVSLVSAIGPEPTRIDVRSKSRLGKSDFGTNAKRVSDFLAKLKE
jgi:uncharacterized protein (DUF1499 family)